MLKFTNKSTSKMNRTSPKFLLYILAGLALASLTSQAQAISHGCTPPTGDINDITIDVSLGGKKSQVSGTFCSAIDQAENLIAKSKLSKKEKTGARQTLQELQTLVANNGRSAAGRRVKGSAGCSGSAHTGTSGSGATVTCGFKIRYGG